MRSILLASSLLATAALAAPAQQASLKSRLDTFLAEGSGSLSQLDLSSLYSLSRSSSASSKSSSSNATPLTVRFTKTTTSQHSKLRYVVDNGLEKRQGGSDNGTASPGDATSELLNFDNTRYIASINIAGQDLDVILDTGSTDTFVYSAQPRPFQGIDPSLLPPLFNNDTAVGLIDTGLVYEAQYGAGNGITTTLGAIQLADVHLNGTDFSVSNLTFANLYQSSAATGASGLLGLGFPINGIIWLTILDTQFNTTGEILTREQSERLFPIVPLLEFEERIPQSLFSVVVDRDPVATNADDNRLIDFNYTEGGTLTLGGYPENMSESDFTWSPVPVVQFTQQGQARGLPAATGNRWTTPLEAIYFNGVKLQNTTLQSDVYADGGQYYMLIDTGNPSFSLPRDQMVQITNAWAANPDNYYVPCDTPFDLQLQIGGANFTMSKTDFLVPSYLALDSLGYGGDATQGCQFQAQVGRPTRDELGPGTSITYTAGAPFLRNVVSVYDYGNIWDSTTTPPRIGLSQRTQ